MNASFKVYFEVPEQISDEKIQALVAHYKKTGCQETRDAIIESHIRLALGVVSRYVGPNRRRKDDLISAALHGLTQAVEWAPERLHDNNITPYIWATMVRFVREFLTDDHVITIERREFKKRLLDGGIYATLPYFYKTEPIDSDEENYQDSELIDYAPPVHDDPTTELDEMLLHLHQHDKTLMLILDRLRQSYTMEEIGKELGCTKQNVSKMVADIRERVSLWRKWHG